MNLPRTLGSILSVVCLSLPAHAQDAASDPLVRPYGILIARIVGATDAVESFSQPNASAITAAANPLLADHPSRSRYSFQVAQSRLGLWANEKGAVFGQVEVDFIDFAKSTPTVASLPRLRIARVGWRFAEGQTVFLGQHWDLHAPLNPHGINMVGALFQGGNIAFMRQQLQYTYEATSMEFGAALGFPNANNTPFASVTEIATPPTVALRGAYRWGRNRVGASALGTALPFAYGTDRERQAIAGSVSLFADLEPLPSTNIRVELNGGQNGANLGTLGIAQGSVGADVVEVGGFISARHVLTERQAVYAILGTQRVVGDARPQPSIVAPPPAGRDPAVRPALAGTGPGLRDNNVVRAGYEFRPIERAGLIVEGFYYQSRHAMHDEDLRSGVDDVRRALGVELGATLSF